MLDFVSLVNKLIEIFLFLCVGFIGRRLRLFDEQGNKVLSRYIVYLGCPALLLGTAMNMEEQYTGGQLLYYVGVTFIWVFALLILAWFLSRILAKGGSERGSYAFMLAFGNIGIFGLPVIRPLFGLTGMGAATLFNIPFNILIYSVGVMMIQGGRKEGQKLWKLWFSPPVIVAFLLPLLFLLHLSYPAPVVTAVTAMGDMTLPLLMFTVGSTLSTMRFQELVGNWKVDCTVALKLLVIPVLIYPLLRLTLSGDETLRGVSQMLACMPPAGVSTALNILYGEHEKESGAVVFLSTLLSLLTIPLMVRLLLM